MIAALFPASSGRDNRKGPGVTPAAPSDTPVSWLPRTGIHPRRAGQPTGARKALSLTLVSEVTLSDSIITLSVVIELWRVCSFLFALILLPWCAVCFIT